MDNDAKTTSYIVAGIGVAVTALGWSLLPSQWGAGIMGFGLAHGPRSPGYTEAYCTEIVKTAKKKIR